VLVTWRWLSSRSLRRVVRWNFTDVSEVLAAYNIMVMRLIALMMEAANTSEKSINFYRTTRRSNRARHLFSLSPPWEPEISQCTYFLDYSLCTKFGCAVICNTSLARYVLNQQRRYEQQCSWDCFVWLICYLITNFKIFRTIILVIACVNVKLFYGFSQLLLGNSGIIH
jgi:hypothetical protein